LLIPEEHEEMFRFKRHLHKIASGESAIPIFPLPRRKVMTGSN
jgi:hypothetical protein